MLHAGKKVKTWRQEYAIEQVRILCGQCGRATRPHNLLPVRGRQLLQLQGRVVLCATKLTSDILPPPAPPASFSFGTGSEQEAEDSAPEGAGARCVP